MKVRSERGAEIGVPKGAAIYGDLDDVRMSRAVWVVDEEDSEGMRVRAGDFQRVLDVGAPGMVVRYVTFPAGEDLEALATAYTEGFGVLGQGLNEAAALLVNDEERSVVSLTVWRDRAALDTFLAHEGFVHAGQRLAPYSAGEPRAENLRVL